MHTEITELLKEYGWVEMWALAAALLFGAKWLTLHPRPAGITPSRARVAGYVFLWPGLDAKAFLGPERPPRPRAVEWVWAAWNTALGAGLIWLGARLAWTTHPTLAAWVAMVGLALLIHFGLFALVSLSWREAGVKAEPIMRSPAAATSLGQFWGGRWNRAFSDFMQARFFKPWAKRFGARRAMLAVFLVSGLLHEIVISIPARGGFGWPTGYFLMQAMGFFVERSRFGAWMGLGRGVHGWLFTVLVTVGPAYWLFHPVFVRNVILPMLRDIGAT